MKKFTCYLLIVCILLSISSVTIMAADKQEATNDYCINEQNSDAISPITYQSNSEAEQYLSLRPKGPYTEKITDVLSYDLILEQLSKCDNITISYLSTESIILSDYSSDTLSYTGEDIIIPLAFCVSSFYKLIDIELNYEDVLCEEIKVYANAYLEGTIVQSVSLTIYIYATEYGCFLSCIEPVNAFCLYLNSLFENELISAEENKKAKKTLSEMYTVEIGEADISSKDFVQSVLEKKNAKAYRYYDKLSQKVQTKSDNELGALRLNQSFSNHNRAESLLVNAEQTEAAQTSVIITRYISAINSGAQLEIYGYVSWTGILGTLHPARRVMVQVFDEDPFFDSLLGTTETNDSGYFSLVVNNSTDIFERGCDIYIKVNLSNNDAYNSIVNSKFKILPDSSMSDANSTEFSEGYFFTTPVTDNVTTSVVPTASSCSGENRCNAMYIHQAAIIAFAYYDAYYDAYCDMYTPNSEITLDLGGSYLSIVYPNVDNRSYSKGSLPEVYIANDDYCNIATVTHELGHQVARVLDLKANVGGEHSYTQNLILTYGKNRGVYLAWSEGLATFFSIAAQNYFCSSVPYSDNIVGISSGSVLKRVEFINDSAFFDIVEYDFSVLSGSGEGNENTVTAILYTLLNDINYTYNDFSLWLFLHNTGSKYLSQFINELYEDSNEVEISVIGSLLENHNVVASPYDQFIFSTSALFSDNEAKGFFWVPINTSHTGFGSTYSYTYKNDLIIRNESYEIVYRITLDDSTNAVNKVSFNNNEWQELFSNIDSDVFYWQLCTYHTDSTTLSTGVYYSSLAKAIYKENVDLSTIDSNSNRTSGYVSVNGEKWFHFRSTESRNYCFFSLGSVDVKADLFLGTDFRLNNPYIENDDGGEGLNFKFGLYLNAGTDVYVRVTGWGSSTGSFDILCSAVTDIVENGIYTDEIDGRDMEGVIHSCLWYRFEAPASKSYSFYSDGLTDVKGDLFLELTDSTTTDGRLAYDDDSGEIGNFIINYYLEEGEVVYLRVTCYNQHECGEIDICVVEQ